jgi:hypothetical protein
MEANKDLPDVTKPVVVIEPVPAGEPVTVTKPVPATPVESDGDGAAARD